MTAQEMIAVAVGRGCTAGVCAFETIQPYLLSCRAAARLPERAATVLCVLFPYRFAGDPPENLSRYAAVPDYHLAAGAVLERIAADLRIADPDGRYETFMDNSPIPEVSAAVAAGLGVRGDNGLLISHAFGSFVFIGTVVTDRNVGASAVPPEGCLHCGACALACPGGCLPGNERHRCLSALTQKKGELTPEEQQRLIDSGSAWGCDRCQEVCPMNVGKPCAPHPCFSGIQRRLTEADLEQLEGKAYGWRGRAVPERNLRLLKKTEDPM